MHSLMTMQFSAQLAEHSSAQISREQYLLSRMQYPLKELMFPPIIHTIILQSLILRIYRTTRFLLCFAISWAL